MNKHYKNYYEADYVFDPSRATVWKQIIMFISRFVNEADVVVDLGAGYCDFINNVEAKTRYAIDISPELSKHTSDGVIPINSLAWDLNQIESGSVDVVHASNLFEHFDDNELLKAIAETKRILKDGGTLILMQPNFRYSYKEYFDDYTHKKIFTHVSLEAFLVNNGFSILMKKPKFLPFSLKSSPIKLPFLSLVVWVYLRSPFKPLAGQMLFVAKKGIN